MPPKKSLGSLSPCVCFNCQILLPFRSGRPLSSSSFFHAPSAFEDATGLDMFTPALKKPAPPRSGLGQLSMQSRREQRPPATAQAATQPTTRPAPSSQLSKISRQAQNEAAARPSANAAIPDSHHLHVYATKHNTHLTFTSPTRDPLLSLAAGNIGFRKSQRGSFDAAYQLSSFVMGKIQERGFTQNMNHLEVVLRGFGAGREAFQKALLGNEGRGIKGKVTRVTDSTRLKFGGTRSKNVRRL